MTVQGHHMSSAKARYLGDDCTRRTCCRMLQHEKGKTKSMRSSRNTLCNRLVVREYSLWIFEAWPWRIEWSTLEFGAGSIVYSVRWTIRNLATVIWGKLNTGCHNWETQKRRHLQRGKGEWTIDKRGINRSWEDGKEQEGVNNPNYGTLLWATT